MYTSHPDPLVGSLLRGFYGSTATRPESDATAFEVITLAIALRGAHVASKCIVNASELFSQTAVTAVKLYLQMCAPWFKDTSPTPP